MNLKQQINTCSNLSIATENSKRSKQGNIAFPPTTQINAWKCQAFGEIPLSTTAVILACRTSSHLALGLSVFCKRIWFNGIPFTLFTQKIIPIKYQMIIIYSPLGHTTADFLLKISCTTL